MSTIQLKYWKIDELKNLALFWSPHFLVNFMVAESYANKETLIKLLKLEVRYWIHEYKDGDRCPGCGEEECELTCTQGIKFVALFK